MASTRNDWSALVGIGLNGFRDNPITHNPFVADNTSGLIAPGAPEFIVTEGDDPLMITTETGIPLVTE
jgi:hypothetical protein